MSPERTELPRLQRWMQEVIVHPGTVEEAIESVGATKEIPGEGLGEVVLPSRSMTSTERVGVYHGMYLMRMQEALETDYPVIRYHLGDHQFSHLVREYVQHYPSISYTLNRLGDHLPRFFLDHDWPQAEFLHDLARLELAMTEVFDEEESPVLGRFLRHELPLLMNVSVHNEIDEVRSYACYIYQCAALCRRSVSRYLFALAFEPG